MCVPGKENLHATSSVAAAGILRGGCVHEYKGVVREWLGHAYVQLEQARSVRHAFGRWRWVQEGHHRKPPCRASACTCAGVPCCAACACACAAWWLVMMALLHPPPSPKCTPHAPCLLQLHVRVPQPLTNDTPVLARTPTSISPMYSAHSARACSSCTSSSFARASDVAHSLRTPSTSRPAGVVDGGAWAKGWGPQRGQRGGCI